MTGDKPSDASRRSVLAAIDDGAGWVAARVVEAARQRPTAGDVASAVRHALPALGQVEVLRWLESLTEAPATIYDRAMDAEYLRTHVGGGLHRLFDGGHDLASAWQRAREASAGDTLSQEALGYLAAIWKDVTTPAGLPFVTLDRDAFAAFSDALCAYLPVSAAWVSDAVAFDAVELMSSALSVASTALLLSRGEREQAARLLGVMVVTGALSANPVLLVCAAAAAAWAVRRGVTPTAGGVLRGGTGALAAHAAFAVLGLPFLVELVIAVLAARLAQKMVFEPEEVATTARALVGRVKWVTP